MYRSRDEFAQGRIGDAIATLDGALDLLGEGGGRELALHMRGELLPLTFLYGERAPSAGEEADALLAEIESASLTRVRRAALVTVTLAAFFAGRTRDEVLPLALRALDDGRLLAEETSESNSLYSLTFVLHGLDEIELEERMLTDAIADAQRRGSVMAFATASSCRVPARYFAGRLVDAIADGEAAARAREYGWEQYRAANQVGVGPRRSRARRPGRRGGCPGRRGRPGDRGPGRVDPVAAGARSPCARLRRPGGGSCLLPRVGRDRGLAEPDGAGRLALERSALLALGERRRGDRPGGRGGRAGARGAGAAGRRRGAPGARAGVGQRRASGGGSVLELESSPSRLPLAHALVDLGAGLRRSGRRADARGPLKRGRDMAVAMGAVPLARRASDELRASGARATTIERAGGLASLTPSEQRIARMARDGMKNREIAQALFVTVKAVEYHLANAYRKLGIARRAELAAALR